MSDSSYTRVRQWRKNHKQKLIDGFGGKCGKCSLEDDQVVFDFHHLDPKEKDFVLSSKIMSEEKAFDEAKKCVLLCSNCHRKVHAGAIVLPEDIQRFDENLIDRKNKCFVDECPVCGKDKPKFNITCSLTCAAKRRSKVDWNFDILIALEKAGSVEALSFKLGISGAAVSKRLRKLGLR